MPRGHDSAHDPRRQVPRPTPVSDEGPSVREYVHDAYEPGDPKGMALEMWEDERW